MKAAGMDVLYTPTSLLVYPDSVRAMDNSEGEVKTIWYLGGESIRLTNVLLTNPYSDVRIPLLFQYTILTTHRFIHMTLRPTFRGKSRAEATSFSCDDMA